MAIGSFILFLADSMAKASTNDGERGMSMISIDRESCTG